MMLGVAELVEAVLLGIGLLGEQMTIGQGMGALLVLGFLAP